jgi:hypothetical protein
MNDVLINIQNIELNLSGLIVGGASFLIIIFGRWACIAGEYYFSKKIWISFLLVGIMALLLSLLLKSIVIASVLSIFGLTMLWGIHEVIEQEERVKKGWFPENPAKVKK